MELNIKNVNKPLLHVLAYWPTKCMEVIAGSALLFIMFLTTCDVVLRAFGKPIVGTYELVSFGGGIIVGFAIPITSLSKSHVFVDLIFSWLTERSLRILKAITRFAGICLFVFLGINLFIMGLDFKNAGEVSLTLQLPFYSIPFGIGIACFVESLVLVSDLVNTVRGE